MDSAVTEIVKPVLEAYLLNLNPLQIKKEKANISPKWSTVGFTDERQSSDSPHTQ